MRGVETTRNIQTENLMSVSRQYKREKKDSKNQRKEKRLREAR